MPAASPEAERGVPIELAAHSRYRIVRRLGRGGMGDVYLAEHRLMERLVAVKVILPQLMAHPSLVERFHREVKAAAKLAHPNIVTAYDAEQAGGLHFLVMEYVEGVDLAQVVAKHGPLPVIKACHFVRQAALGLQHAFEKGMVHRDIKPQNLMLTPKGQVKILDFGIARFAREKFAPASPADVDDAPLVPGGTQLTKSGAVVGTADYMAPEQAVNAHQADTRADVYSLGCSFYYLLTGQVPFPGGAFVDKIMRHAEEHWVSLERLRPDLTPEVVAVVNKMMAKKPARRFQTPAEVAKALEPIIRAATVKPATPPAAADAHPSSAPTKATRSSTYGVAEPPAPRVMDIAAILAAEIPPMPAPDEPKKAARLAARWYLIAPAATVTLAVAVWAVLSVISSQPATGTLEVVSPVAVAVKQNGRTVKLIEPQDARTLELRVGEYDLVLSEARDEFALDREHVTLEQGARQRVSVTRKAAKTPPISAPKPAPAGEPDATAPPSSTAPPSEGPSLEPDSNTAPTASRAGGAPAAGTGPPRTPVASLPTLTVDQLLEQAQDRLKRGEIEGCIASYRQVLAADPNHRRALLGLGFVLQQVGGQAVQRGDRNRGATMYLEAAAVMRKLHAAHPDLNDLEKQALADALYNEACAYNLRGEADKALASLREAVDAGYRDVGWLETDSDLATLRHNPEFKSIRAEMAKKAAEEDLAKSESFPFDFRLTDLDGHPIKLADFTRKVLIVEFSATWRPEQIPHFVELKKYYGKDGLEIVGLNCDPPAKKGVKGAKWKALKDFATRHAMNYPCAIVNEATKKMVPNLTEFPTTLFIDRMGKVRLKMVGAQPLARLQAIVKRLLAEPAPAAGG